MFRRCGVGSYRGGQSLGSTAARQGAAYPNSDTHGYSRSHTDGYSDSHSDPDPNTYPNSDTHGYADAYGDPDGYTNANDYADANSVTRALCTRCQCGY